MHRDGVIYAFPGIRVVVPKPRVNSHAGAAKGPTRILQFGEDLKPKQSQFAINLYLTHPILVDFRD